MQEWLCLVGSSTNSASAIRRLGFRCNAVLDKRRSVSKEFLDLTEYMLPANLQDDDEVDACFAKLVAQLGLPKALVSHTEHGYPHVARLSEKHGLPANSVATVAKVRDKAAMRRVLQQNTELAIEIAAGDGETIVRYLRGKDSLNTIVKPIDGWGSRYISHIMTAEDIEAWEKDVAPHWPRWIAEDFISGPEYSVEIVRYAGDSFLLGMTEKRTTGAPYYVETGHLFPSPSTPPEVVSKVLERVSLALDLLDVRIGAAHTEVRIDPVRGPMIIETHTRPGGDYISEMVYYTTGLDIAELSIASALGHAPPPPAHHQSGAAIQFFMQREGFCSAIKACRPIDPEIVKKWEFEVLPGNTTVATTDSPTRAGCALCVGPDAVTAWSRTEEVFKDCGIEFGPA